MIVGRMADMAPSGMWLVVGWNTEKPDYLGRETKVIEAGPFPTKDGAEAALKLLRAVTT